MPTLIDRLRHQHETRPDAVFCHLVKDGVERPITFAGLFAGAARYAALYRRTGLGAGDVVCVILRHSDALLHAFVGGLMAGCTPAYLPPLSHKQDPARYWDSLVRTVATVGPKALVLGDDERDDALVRLSPASLAVITPAGAAADAPIRWSAAAPDDIAFLQFSSGTTGQRKGVMLTHRAVEAQLAAYAPAVGLDGDAVVASWLPLYHDMGLIAGFIAPLALGLPITLLDPFDWVAEPSSLLRAIERHRVTHVWLPNFAFNHLVATAAPEQRFDLGSVRAFINCSEPCKPASFDRFLARFAACGVTPATLQCCYAMAEAVFAVSQTSMGRAVRRLRVDNEGSSGDLLSVGRPLPGFEVEVRDESGRVLDAGQVGEIAIRGPSVSGGYYRASTETETAFSDGWYLTGDLGLLLEGELLIAGRRKDVVICYGRNYYAHDIEEIVGEVPGVKPGRAVAFGIANANTGSEDLVVVAEAVDLAAANRRHGLARAIKAAVLSGLNVTVAKVRLVPPMWLVKTTSGKLGRGENRAKYLATMPTEDDRHAGAA